MWLKNFVFKLFISIFVVVYFVDILMYIIGPKGLLKHLHKVLEVLDKQKLYVNLKKCELITSSSVFLGYYVVSGSIHLDSTKVEVILSWLTPAKIHEVWSFHIVASF